MNNATAVGIADGGGTVGTLTISNVGVGVGSNLGSAIDIDQGGTLNVLLESVTSIGRARASTCGTTTGTFRVTATASRLDRHPFNIGVRPRSPTAASSRSRAPTRR